MAVFQKSYSRTINTRNKLELVAKQTQEPKINGKERGQKGRTQERG